MMVEIYVCGPSAVHKIIVSTSKGKNEKKKKKSYDIHEERTRI